MTTVPRERQFRWVDLASHRRQPARGGRTTGVARRCSAVSGRLVRRPEEGDESVDKPDSVCPGEGAGRSSICDRCYQRPGATYPETQASSLQAFPQVRRGAPSWSCSRWGLPSHPSHLGCWWSLTPPFHPYRPQLRPAVCFLWHCPAGHPGWALPTTVLSGVRTFLDRSEERPRPPDRLVRGPL